MSLLVDYFLEDKEDYEMITSIPGTEVVIKAVGTPIKLSRVLN